MPAKRTKYSLPPRGYSRARAQRRGRARARGRRPRRVYRPGYDRTGGYYGRVGHGELKFHDVDLDDAAISTGGDIVASVALIPQGTTEVQRNGRRCTIKAINWRYDLNLATQDAVATPPVTDTVRVIMYLDRQCNGAAPAVTQILESADFQSFNNLAEKNRFRTLMDRTVNMNFDNLASDGAGVVSATSKQVSFQFYKKVNIPMEFDSTTGAITEIRSNNIGVLMISKNNVTVMAGKIRLRFVG